MKALGEDITSRDMCKVEGAAMDSEAPRDYPPQDALPLPRAKEISKDQSEPMRLGIVPTWNREAQSQRYRAGVESREEMPSLFTFRMRISSWCLPLTKPTEANQQEAQE